MNWNNYFKTSIGKKILVGATGLFLTIFLVVHCYVNAMVFWPNDQGKHFTGAAAFMGGNPAIRIVEIGLFAAFLIHIVQALLLWRQNISRRSVGYNVKAGNATSKWYSRSMGLLGTLILMFLILHLYHFWGPNRYGQAFSASWKEDDLYNNMKTTFSELWVVVVYILACISLAWHLMHGFYSSFQTFGLAAHRYKSCISVLGVAFSIIIPLIFAMMPVAFYMQWVS
ncbi:MAG: succinate dehydrogenase cytochrome b subunit [Chitinophagales bacterium]